MLENLTDHTFSLSQIVFYCIKDKIKHYSSIYFLSANVFKSVMFDFLSFGKGLTFFVFLSKIHKIECKTMSDWLNRMVKVDNFILKNRHRKFQIPSFHFSVVFLPSGQCRSKIRLHILCSLILICTGSKGNYKN